MTLRDELTALVDDLVPEISGEGCSPESLWENMVELGLPVVGISESKGGSGGSLEDLSVLAEALGAKGTSTPLIEATVANWVLAEAGEPFADGRNTVTIAEPAGRHDELFAVPWAQNAARLVVVWPDSTPGIARVDIPGTVVPGFTLAEEPSDTVRLGATAVRQLDNGPSATAIRSRLGLLRSAALSGALRGTYAATRSHVRTREQFGAPLIEIPAVAHALATMKTHLLQVQTAVDRAVGAATEDPLDAAPVVHAVAAARVIAASAAGEAARIAHQLHGAIGITQELALHQLTTRLWVWRDADLPASHWAAQLGEAAITGGEASVWHELTA
ncbi:acyl-CoA dehydrogenase family protein [Rhodococcus olei]|uniref:Acyl-CoA dehydrogenase family protein n=1 Tax=Rhodococcus olei TaxID=2161675 RepID=A0ABP8PUD1_9NOCA